MSTLRTAVISATLVFAVNAEGHHSPFLFFDPSTMIETVGEVVDVQWRNPHVLFEVRSNDDGALWTIEANAVSILKRMNLTPEAVKVGDQVSVAGWPAKRSGNEMFVINMLMQNGQEIVFMPGLPSRWSENIEGDASAWMVTENDLTATGTAGDDIFHVWSTSLGVAPEEVLLFDRFDFPLTEEAASARASYDMYSSPILAAGCVHKGMPTIMEQPYPMELIQGDNVILLRMEEGDAMREIDMTPGANSSGREPTPMGHSFGHWEGSTLVVRTSGSSWPHIDMTGVPNSADAEYVERFTPSADGKRLNYTMTIAAPSIFSEPPTFSKYWLNVPDASVDPYNCDATAEF